MAVRKARFVPSARQKRRNSFFGSQAGKPLCPTGGAVAQVEVKLPPRTVASYFSCRAIAGKDLLTRHSRDDIIQNHLHHDPGASDACLAVADRRIDADALLPIPHNFYSNLAKQARGPASLQPAVHFLPVSHLHHENDEDFIPNLIDDSVVLPRPHIEAVELLLRLQLLHAMRARIRFQAETVPVHLLSDVRIELAQLPLSGGSDFNAVGQDSVSQFPHEVPKRNRPLLFSLF